MLLGFYWLIEDALSVQDVDKQYLVPSLTFSVLTWPLPSSYGQGTATQDQVDQGDERSCKSRHLHAGLDAGIAAYVLAVQATRDIGGALWQLCKGARWFASMLITTLQTAV